MSKHDILPHPNGCGFSHVKGLRQNDGGPCCSYNFLARAAEPKALNSIAKGVSRGSKTLRGVEGQRPSRGPGAEQKRGKAPYSSFL